MPISQTFWHSIEEHIIKIGDDGLATYADGVDASNSDGIIPWDG